MERERMTQKQIREYKELIRAKNHGRFLTPDGVILICEAYQNNPEAIGRHFLELAAKFKAEKGTKIYE